MAKKKTVKKTTRVRSLPARKARNVKGGSPMASTLLRMLSDEQIAITRNLRG